MRFSYRHPGEIRQMLSVIVPLSLFAVIAAATTACAPNADECLDNEAFFRERVQSQVLEPVCMACHTPSGSARESDLVLSTIVTPNYLDVNLAGITDMAGLEREGNPLLLLKPLGDENHGGGAILDSKSEEYQILEEFVERLENPVECKDKKEDVQPEEIGLVLASPAQTLRKAALQLSGRLPSPDESELIFSHGEAGLGDAVDLLMQDEQFDDIVMEMWNDILLTDKYYDCCDAIGLVDYDRYPNLYWYNGTSAYNTNRSRLNAAIAREPLEIIGRVIREDLPFTEVLNARWTMVNEYSAFSYSTPGSSMPVHTENTSLEFWPVELEGIPHAGVLTTPAYLNRFPTTDTNRNRHRSWAFYKAFLATDILQMADRPIDITDSEVHNPTLNDPQCNICHAVMEPVAGLFQNWDEDGALNPIEEGWYPEMYTPGFGEEELPSSQKVTSLQWLAQKTTADGRFPLAIARQVFHTLTGLQIINAAEIGDNEEKKATWQEQTDFLTGLADDFKSSEYDYRVLVRGVVLSHFYRAVGNKDADSSTLAYAGSKRLHSPTQLNRKILQVTGFPWRTNYRSKDHLSDRYKMLYGGIDSDSVTERLVEPNGIIANIGLRMATELACVAVSNDFVIQKDQRRIFPWVEIGYQPVTPDGLNVPEAVAKIKQNLKYLHYRVTGEQLHDDHPELEQLYTLWHETWEEGRQKIASEEVSEILDSRCDAQHEYWTNTSLPVERRLYNDPHYTIRAWMAVLTYELTDPRFLYE
jgi:hypothetical protein